MPERCLLLAVFFALQTVAVHWITGMERPVQAPVFTTLPDRIGLWTSTRTEPVPIEADGLGADAVVRRSYVDEQTGNVLTLFIAWYRSQRYGVTQPHSPLVCLPGSGWTRLSSESLSAGSAQVTLQEVAHNYQRVFVAYWYQTAQRAVADEWSMKARLVADSLLRHRSDVALVRITVSAAARNRAGLAAFIGDFQPRFQALYDTESR